jgi:ribose transport system substrate-binding protein
MEWRVQIVKKTTRLLNIVLLVLAILLVSVFTACKNGEEAATAEGSGTAEDTGAAKEPAEKRVYDWIGAVVEVPYFIDHRVGLEIAEDTFGVETKYLGPQGYDMEGQANTIEQQIGENPAGMDIIGFVEELAPAINQAIDAGIPVVTLDADTASSNRYTFIGTGNYNAGRQSGKLLGDAINGKGKVALITVIGQTNLDERSQGFKDELAENYPGIELVQVIDCGADEQKTVDGVKAALQANPDLAGIAGVEQTGGNGAAIAVKEMNMAGDVVIVAMDRNDTTLKAIEDGIIYASVAQKSALMSYLGIMLMEGLNNNAVSITQDDKAAGIVAMPNYIDTGTLAITKDNAKYFYHKADPYDFGDWKLTPAGKDETYVWIGAVVEVPYFIDHRVGLEAAEKELGIKTKYLGPQGYDMEGLMNTIEQQIGEDPAGMVIIGFVEELAPAINMAIDAGIPVITLDADTATSNRYTFIGTGNYNAGRQSGKLLGDAVGGKGKVALITVIGQTNLDERSQGFKDELAENYPGIELVQVIDCGADEQKTVDGVKAALQANPDLVGIAGVEQTGGNGAAIAVKEMNMVGDVIIVAMDRNDTTLKAIEDGVIYASVAQKSALMSYLGVKLLYYFNHGPVPITQDDKAAGIVSLPGYIDTGTIAITRDNAKYFYH